MAEIKVTKDNFEAEVLHSSQPVLVDFYADWCGPCQMVGPVLHEIAEERTDIKVGKVNVDDEMQLAVQYGISSIPALLVFKDGQVVNRAVGARPKAGILALLD